MCVETEGGAGLGAGCEATCGSVFIISEGGGGWRGGGGDHHIAGQFIQLSVHTGARDGGARRGRHHENSVMVLLQSIY